MKYLQYRNAIQGRLRKSGAGMTWLELKESLRLPYDRPCPEWTRRLEKEIGLDRREKRGRSLVWKIGGSKVR